MPNDVNDPDFDVSYVADLARLELSDEEKDRLKREFSSILTYIDELKELDVSGIEPTAHATPLSNVLRDDQAVPTFTKDQILENAPATVDGELIKVPQVLPGEEMA